MGRLPSRSDSVGHAGDRHGWCACCRGRLATRLAPLFGGPGRARVVVLLAAVLALNSADIGTIGAAAQQLETSLDISHAQLGLLAAASSGIGPIATIPMWVLADRAHRMRLLLATIVVW